MKQLTLATALVALLLSVPDAKADFLGLAPGDYTITLLNSTSLCAGSNCTGTVHIGSPGATGFDWSFAIGAELFEFDGPTQNTSIAPNGQTSCAFERNIGDGSCVASDTGIAVFTINSLPKHFALLHDPSVRTGPNLWQYRDGDFQPFTAAPISSVPELPASMLLLFGVSVLGLRQQLTAKFAAFFRKTSV